MRVGADWAMRDRRTRGRSWPTAGRRDSMMSVVAANWFAQCRAMSTACVVMDMHIISAIYMSALSGRDLPIFTGTGYDPARPYVKL